MTIEDIGKIRVVTPETAQIDVMNANEFGTKLMQALDEGASCILDLQNVIFLDSSALGRIVIALRNCKMQGRHFIICGATEAVALLFKMVRLAQIADILPDRETALARLNGEAV